MLAFSKKPKSVQTKFSNDNFNYFVGSPITPQLKNYPLLNSGNGVGATFLKWSDTDLTSTNIESNFNPIFYPKEVYGDILENDTKIPINIDTVYKSSFNNDIIRYPSNTFFEIPDEWIFADTWTQNINIKDTNNMIFTSNAMFTFKKKGTYQPLLGTNPFNVYGYKSFNDNSKNPYNDVINPDIIFLYGEQNIDKYGYYNNWDKPDSDDKYNDYWFLWGGTIYDYGWWYKLNQIGINSLFYPQNIFIPDTNKKIPIWNLSSIVNSILNFNKNAFSMEGLGLINAVAPCVVKVEDYSTLEWGPMNNEYGNRKCAKGNTLLYIKAARTSTGVNNPSNIRYTLFTDEKVMRRGMYDTAFPPFYGCFEFSMGQVNKKPSQYYDKSGNLLSKPSNKYYIIKENQFGICPQIPRGLKSSSNNPNGQSNIFINAEFTCYIVNTNFFQSPPDHKPWWCFEKAYEILYINFKSWFDYNSKRNSNDDITFLEFPELNNYHLLPKDEDSNQKGLATNILNLTKLLQNEKFDRIFEGRNEAIIIYPSSLLVYERFPTDQTNEDSIYNSINSPGIILRNNTSNLDIPGYGNLYIRLRPVDHFYSIYDHFNAKNDEEERLINANFQYYNVINNPLNVISDTRGKSTWIADNKNKEIGDNIFSRAAYTAGASLFNIKS